MRGLQPAFLVRSLVVCATAGMLAGCLVQDGDFGRPRASVVNDEILPWLGRHTARARGEPVSGYPFTDNERELRQLGYALVMPGHPADHWNRFWAELIRTRVTGPSTFPPDPNAYCHLLAREGYRSSRARFTRITDDVRADRNRIAPFFGKAGEVVAADRVREGALARLVDLRPVEVRSARDRIAENRMVIDAVRQGLVSRVASYRCALHTLLVATPDQEAIMAERELLALERDVAGMDGLVPGLPAARVAGPSAEPYFPMSRRIAVEQAPPEEPVISK